MAFCTAQAVAVELLAQGILLTSAGGARDVCPSVADYVLTL